MFSGHSYHKLQGDPSRSNTTNTRISRRSSTTAFRLSPVPEQAKTTTLTMKVKELRSWLSEVGDKHQEHYHRFHHHSPPCSSSNNKSPTSESGKNDLLGIQSKPSMTSTCPSTAIVEENDPFFGASFSSDDDDSSNQEVRRSDLYHQTNGESARKLFDDEGVEHVTSKDHLALLLKQAPRNQEKGIYCSVNHADDSYDDERDDDDSVALRNNGPSMHNSNVFRDQLLTKATLDAMSRSLDDARKAPKTLGEQLQQLDEDRQEQQQRTFVTPGSDSEDSNNNTESLGLSSSKDSTDAPSIAPGVLVSKMANIFLNQHGNSNGNAASNSTRDCEQMAPPPPPLERRRYVDPEDLSFLRSSNYVYSNSACLVAQREDLAYAKPPKTPPTTVGKGIRKFGGPRKTLVERRKEQLHENFGETRAATFVHKKTWDQKTAYGKYQRTTTVEKLYK